MHEIAVGTAGWAIPGQYRSLFGDGDSVLARYATRFSVVEINSSFYRSHRQATYARWAASVPDHFRFSVKVPKRISHELGLRGCGPALDRFLGEIAGLGDKLGGALLQLPPTHQFDMRSASVFFRMWQRRIDVPVACEPRHPSWASPAAQALLQRLAVSRVRADPPLIDSPAFPCTSPWPYWRLHGAPRIYYSPYQEETLQAVAKAATSCRTAGRAPWVIFDNTAHGFAAANAARLQDMLGSPVKRRRL